MLGREHALVRSDPEVPGLRLLLDRGAVLKAIQNALPELEATDVRATYLRYKPATSCLAGFDLLTPDGWRGAYAKSFRHDAADKLRKASVRAASAQRPYALLAHASTVVCPFPLDLTLPSLSLLHADESRLTVLEKLLRPNSVSLAKTLHPVHHRPERRYVARLDGSGTSLTLKMHRPGAFERARMNVKVISATGDVRTPKMVGRSRRHGIVALEWLEGPILADVFAAGAVDTAHVRNVGEALRSLHTLAAIPLRARDRLSEIATVGALSTSLQMLLPERALWIDSLARRLAARLEELPEERRVIHGDFHAGQVVLTADGVTFIDLDEAALGDPLADLGTFLAEREYAAIAAGSPVAMLDWVSASLLEGYAGAQGARLSALSVHTAIGLFARAPHPFRNREPAWPDRVEAVLARSAQHLDAPRRARSVGPCCEREATP
ncbi:hypothetical protein BH23DEI1_BH23DEI1_12020 [soil metagenome]